MKNILFVGITDDKITPLRMGKFITDNIDSCHMILNDVNNVKKHSEIGECYSREELAKGKCDIKKLLRTDNVMPIDEEVFNQILPYSIEILDQQRRFEEYHLFRIDKSYTNHYEIFMHNLLFLYNLIEQKNITYVVFFSVPHEGYDMLIYQLAKIKQLPVLLIYNSTLPHREYFLYDYKDSETTLRNEYYKLDKQYSQSDTDDIPLAHEAEILFNNWSSVNPDKMIPWYMKGNPLKRRFGIRFGQTNIFREWYEILGKGYREVGMTKGPKFWLREIKDIPVYFKSIEIVLKRWVNGRPVWKRTIQLNKYYDSLATLPIQGEKYIYYALHYQPEASSNPLGGIYTDQRLPINILANSVPDDLKIYVKSHPEQLAPLRSKQYYEDIASMRNVKLIKLGCSTYNLIKNAVAVSSITGTVCWESQFYGIPAITFGYSQKNCAPLSYFVRTQGECKEAIRDILGTEKKIPLRELKLLTKAMYNTSFKPEEREERLIQLLREFVTGD